MPTTDASHPPRDLFPYAKDPWTYKASMLAVVFVPLILTGLAIWRLWGGWVGPLDIALLVVGWAIGGMGITLGFHRMLTHRAFDAKPWVKAVLVIAGSTALQGRAVDWAATHSRHHANADKEGDPHSPLEGFWLAHTGWLFRDRFVRSGPVHARLESDQVVKWVSDRFMLWAILSFLVPAAIGGLVTTSWAGFWSGLLWGGVVRTFLGHHVTWSVNSVAHTFGTRPFETPDEARNNALVAFLGFGEGWHNNHHAFPKAAFIGMRWWQFDPGAYALRLMQRLGWVWNVWNPPRERVRARHV